MEGRGIGGNVGLWFLKDLAEKVGLVLSKTGPPNVFEVGKNAINSMT